MNLGTGIFLSSVFVGTIALFLATKDRWDWKKIVIRTGISAVLLVAIGGLALWSYLTYEERPKPLETFWDLAPGMSRAEVKFRKGEPTDTGKANEKDTDPPYLWVYRVRDGKGWYVVTFKADTVRLVGFHGSPLGGPYVRGVHSSTNPDSLVETFGKPTHVSNSADGLERMYSFER